MEVEVGVDQEGVVEAGDEGEGSSPFGIMDRHYLNHDGHCKCCDVFDRKKLSFVAARSKTLGG